MNNSYISTIMNMYADIYIQENTQNPTTGSIERHWEYLKTVRCLIEPAKSSGASTRADGKEFSNGPIGYKESLQLRGKFISQLSKRWRITNIRSSDNQIIFNQNDLNSNPPTIFEVFSCHPMTDPFGRLSHYDVTLERVNVQNNDTG
jgi:hypothetical protein